METLLLISTVIDVTAVAALAWLLLRGSRARQAVLDEQRAALTTLRGDLAALIEDAERRAESLEATLRARERSLRALVAESGRLDGRRQGDHLAPEVPVIPLAREAAPRGPRRPSTTLDPAEERLLRDLATSLPPR
jgi:hypothetical protein